MVSNPSSLQDQLLHNEKTPISPSEHRPDDIVILRESLLVQESSPTGTTCAARLESSNQTGRNLHDYLTKYSLLIHLFSIDSPPWASRKRAPSQVA